MPINISMLNITSSMTINDSVELIIADTASGAITITLPATPLDGVIFIIKDFGTASTNNLTIDGNSKLIDSAGTLVLNTDFAKTRVVYCSTNDLWLIL